MQPKVVLLNEKTLKDGGFFKEWGEVSHICYNTPIERAEQIGRHCLKSGHFSGSRATFFKFHISGVTRNMSLQLNRHEVGIVKNQLSQRYVDQSDFDYLYPAPGTLSKEDLLMLMDAVKTALDTYKKLSEKIDREEARNILPGGMETAGVYCFTIESLANFMHKRLCTRAQDEIHGLALAMKKKIIGAVPELEELMVPTCEWLLWCPEEQSCGKAMSREEVKALIAINRCYR